MCVAGGGSEEKVWKDEKKTSVERFDFSVFSLFVSFFLFTASDLELVPLLGQCLAMLLETPEKERRGS